MTDFTAFFNRHLQVVTDHRPQVKDEAFRLRYQVYCLEKGFERREAFADRRERDQFDDEALHAIVRHRGCGTTMATLRLVRRQGGGGPKVFPLERSYPGLLSRHGITERMLPRQTSTEISRFAISKDRQQQVRAASGGDSTWRFNGQRYPLVTFGMFVALMRLSALNDVTHWLAVMEPSLLRLLARFGIEFKPIGGLVEYHGRRQPCYGRVDQIRDRVRDAHRDLFELAMRDIATVRQQPMRPAGAVRRPATIPGMPMPMPLATEA